MENDTAHAHPDSKAVAQAVEVLRSRLHRRGLAISISGIDGSGKTTLARDLVCVLEAPGVPVCYLHLHQWYLNVFTTPIRLLYNRHISHKILVFDRSIYDNIAVLSIRRHCPVWLWRMALGAAHACYPKFDYRLYLVVAFGDTLLRRPDTCKNRFITLTQTYNEIASRVQYTQLSSDARLFSTVLRNIAAES